MEGTERASGYYSTRAARGCSDSTRMEGTESVVASIPRHGSREVAATRPAWRVLKEAKQAMACGRGARVAATRPAWRVLKGRHGAGFGPHQANVAATRPAWRVLKDSCRYRGLRPGGMLQRLDPHGGY